MLPENSQASLKEGIWLVYQDGDNIIKFWGSGMSGKEKVYLNDILVSEKRSMKMISEHHFSINNKKYKITCKTISFMNGTLLCNFYRDDQLIKSFNTKIHYTRYQSIFRILILMLATVLFVIVKNYYDLNYYSFIVFILAIAVINFVLLQKGKIIIEE